MPKDNETIQDPIGPVGPTESKPFAPDQMIRCDECLRVNPPTRVNCLYCGAALPVTETSAHLRRPNMRPVEKGSIGFSTITINMGRRELSEDCLRAAADFLKLSADSLARLLTSSNPSPLAFTATQEDATLITERLSEVGIPTITIDDNVLGFPEKISRIRSVNIGELALSVQPARSGGPFDIGWTEISLLVAGRLLTKKIEVKERKSRRNENEILSTSEFYGDEMVLDVYSRQHSQTWRIGSTSFDFSCLADEKSLVATENLSKLTNLLRSRSRAAMFDERYNELRQSLDLIWPTEQETKSLGWRREAPGKLTIGQLTVNTNDAQFSRYSRLRYYLLNKE
ncbi:MAG: hypothetical protein ABR555_11695 [Pyrinomonadaceae bacterium]